MHSGFGADHLKLVAHQFFLESHAIGGRKLAEPRLIDPV
jgi:hypothetical protein